MGVFAKAVIVSAALMVTGAAAGAARAEAVNLAPTVIPMPVAKTQPLNLSTVRPDLAQSVAQADALRAAGVVRTSVDHALANGGLTASAGFLCGLQPGKDNEGGAAAYGVDPNGRFVGAKLSVAF